MRAVSTASFGLLEVSTCRALPGASQCEIKSLALLRLPKL
jgi:hypothetical protein